MLFSSSSKKNSLKWQFLGSTTAVTVIVMMISLLVVDWNYRTELEESFKERLRLHIYGLLSLSQHQSNGFSLPLVMTNPRFNNSDSGLWAMVVDGDDSVIWHSLSLESPMALVDETQRVGEWRYSVLSNSDSKSSERPLSGEEFLVLSYKVAWEVSNSVHVYHFVAAENMRTLDGELNQFRIRLLIGFVLITACLIIVQHLALRRSFRPIGALADEIDAMEAGQQSSLKNAYPVELTGVTENLNALIDKEYQQRKKYRESMADLAHSIKTPLSVIAASLEPMARHDDQTKRALIGAVDRIDQSIEYQLRRAVISGHTVLDRGANVKQALEDLILVLEHAYQGSEIALRKSVEGDVFFAGDENDLLEIFGNLLDNAYKFASKEVNVAAKIESKGLVITVEDDGPGVSEEQRDAIMKRGARMDSKGLGQGIGLAVVINIISSYDGQLEVSRSELGGAKFTVIFSRHA